MLAAWHDPRSSHEMITSRSSGAYPSRSARVVTACTLSTACAPQPEVGTLRGGGQGRELGRVGGVGFESQVARLALGDELAVDEEAVAAEDVREQTAVHVACLDVALESDAGADRQERRRALVRLRPVALHRGVRLDGLRRIDPEQSDALA